MRCSRHIILLRCRGMCLQRHYLPIGLEGPDGSKPLSFLINLRKHHLRLHNLDCRWQARGLRQHHRNIVRLWTFDLEIMGDQHQGVTSPSAANSADEGTRF